MLTSVDMNAFVYAAEISESEDVLSEEVEEDESAGYISMDSDYNAAEYDGDIEEAEDVDTFFDLNTSETADASSAAYPSSDPLEYMTENYPATRQQFEGTCWAHSTIANAEFSSISNGVVSTGASTDFSEYQFAYQAYHFVTDPLGGTEGDYYGFDADNAGSETWYNAGHNLIFVINTLNQWVGVVNESDVPTPEDLEEGVADEYIYDSNEVVMTDTRMIMIKDSDGNLIDSGVEATKAAIVANGAVSTSYYSNSKYRGPAGTSEEVNYYCNVSNTTNHAIAIVGWDDNYSATNFWTEAPIDGAWLVRNSWSSTAEMSCYSYFWLSYADMGLANVVYAMNFTDEDTYDNNYQYDGGNYTVGGGTVSKTSVANVSSLPKSANVFTTTNTTKDEVLKAVNISLPDYSNVHYQIDIYLDPQDDNPSSGTHVENATTIGDTTYAGLYTIPLANEVELEASQSYAVVVTMWTQTDSGTYKVLFAEREYAFHGWDIMATQVTAEEGQSYRYLNGSWSSIATSGNYGNYRIKAFTGYVEPEDNSEYRVVYEGNTGATGSMDETDYSLGVNGIAAECGFEKSGYRFIGWNTEKDGSGTTYQPGDEITALETAGKITLFAQWVNCYSLVFDGNGSTSGSMETLPVEGGQIYTLPQNTYEKTNYVFSGWNTSADGSGTAYGNQINYTANSNRTDNLILYAQWTPVEYTLSYNLNGGTNASANPKTFTINSNVTLASPTRKGYSFGGWYLDSSYQNRLTKISYAALTSAGRSLGNITLYAKWTKVKYTITYVLNGGKNNSANKTAYYVTTTTFTLKNPTRTGYTFAGWYSDAKFKTKVTKITKGTVGNKKLYAKWTVNKYTIKFNGYGATSGKMSSLTSRKYGTTYTLTKNKYKRTGYVFKGWATSKANAKKGIVKYKNGAKVKNLSSKNGATITLYAVWKKK